MKLGESTNKQGTPVSVHLCPSCGQHFTVCPVAGGDWGGCGAPGCASYDLKRDADKLFEEHPEWIRRETH